MRLCSLILCVSAGALAQPVVAPTLTATEQKRLDANEVVISEFKPTDNRGIGVRALGVIDAPTTEVWPVVRDCQHFSSFMPRTKASAVKEEEGVRVCHVELKMPWPLSDLWSDSKSVQREEPAGHYFRGWSLVRGTYRRNTGSWSLVPWGADGKKTLVVYVIDSDPAMVIPDAILRSAQVGSLPEVFTSIRKRVVALRDATARGN
jgi:hypothetical protein